MRLEDRTSFDRMKEFFKPDFTAGSLIWRARKETDYRIGTWNKRFAGRPAGRINSSGYVQLTVRIDEIRSYIQAHRLLMAFSIGDWVSTEWAVDHIDNDPMNNCLSNLRICTNPQNAKNRKLNANNTSGFKGVSWAEKYDAWAVNIQCDNTTRFCGHFQNKLDAAIRYDEMAIELFGCFATTNRDLGLL